MQYTIRNVPKSLDAALRRRAQRQGKSLNEVVIEALAREPEMSGEPRRKRDLRDIAGTWREDPAFDDALAGQHSRNGRKVTSLRKRHSLWVPLW